MPTMTSRERVLAALRRGEPDRVPWVDEWFSYEVADRMLALRGKEFCQSNTPHVPE